MLKTILGVICLFICIFVMSFFVAVGSEYIEAENSNFNVSTAHADTLIGSNLLPLSFTSAIGTPTAVRDTVSAMDSVVFSTSTDIFTGIGGKKYQKVTNLVILHNYSDADTVTYGYMLADSLGYAWLFPGERVTLNPVYLTKMYFKSFQAGTTFVSTQYTLPTVRQ